MTRPNPAVRLIDRWWRWLRDRRRPSSPPSMRAEPIPSDFVCRCSGIPHATGIARCVWSQRAVPPGHTFPCDADRCRRCAHIAAQ